MTVANLNNANLSEAILRQVTMRETILANVDLRATKGLTEIRHDGSSPVALYSVKLPQNDSALHFLRSAGVPDAWIALYQAKMRRPIQYHSVSQDAQQYKLKQRRRQLLKRSEKRARIREEGPKE